MSITQSAKDLHVIRIDIRAFLMIFFLVIMDAYKKNDKSSSTKLNVLFSCTSGKRYEEKLVLIKIKNCCLFQREDVI